MSPPGSRAVSVPGHCQHPAPLQPLCPSAPSSKALTARNRKPYSDLLKLQGIYRLSDRIARGVSSVRLEEGTLPPDSAPGSPTSSP